MKGYIEYHHYMSQKIKLRASFTMLVICVIALSLSFFIIWQKDRSITLMMAAAEENEAMMSEMKEQYLAAVSTKDAAVKRANNLLVTMENMAAVMERAKGSLDGYAADLDVMTMLADTLELDSRVVVDFEDLRKPSNVSEEQLNKLLIGTPLEGHGWEFLEAEHKYGVNAIFMLSKMRHESSLGRSAIAKERNNLGGFRAMSGEWMTFDNFGECIDFSGRLLSEEYLLESGSFYNGTAVRDVNIRYCVNDDGSIDWNWSGKIEQIMDQYVSVLNETGN